MKKVGNLIFKKYLMFFLVFIFFICLSENVIATINSNLPISELKYDENDNSSVFPDSYKSYINTLKALHPNWIFKAVYTNLDWNTVLRHETYEVNRGISTVPDTYPDAWKLNNTNDGNYVDGNFVVASKEAVAYCLDPRNFLNEKEVFQFETLSYSEANSNLDTIDKFLASTVMGTDAYKNKYKNNGSWIQMNKTYSQIIKEAGNESQVSPIYIASRIKQETSGNIANNLSINGSYPGLEGVYNFYNIGATPNVDGTGSIANGLIRAKNEGWTTPELSIKGGINIIKNSYIKWGQDTVYFQKFDVNNPYGNAQYLCGHQYMTNILAPSSEAKNTYSAYKSSGILDDSLEFHIPVYNNMPSSSMSYPGKSAILNIESLIEGTSYSEDILITGWAMSEDKNAKIKISVDGNVIVDNAKRTPREDVLNAIIGYGGRENNPNPGFEASLPIKDIAAGAHNILVEVVSADGRTLKSNSVNISVKKANAILSIETPKNNENVKNIMEVEGWVLCELENCKLEIRVNDTLINADIERISRNDVINAIPGYGGSITNPTPGYKLKIDTSTLQYGTNELEIRLYSGDNNLILVESVNFNIVKYNTRLNIETPMDNIKVKTNITISGWIMSEDENATIKVTLNGIEFNDVKRTPREDVLSAVTDYGGRTTNKLPGFEINIDTSKFVDGTYQLKIQVIDRYDRIVTSNVSYIDIKKYETKLNIESPEGTTPLLSEFLISGWLMSEDKNAKFKVYIDNKETSFELERTKREDVLNAITGCGTKEENEKPGFNITVSTNSLKIGKHTLRVDIMSSTTENEIIKTQTKEFLFREPLGKLVVEEPSNNISITGNKFYITGWAMSEDKNATVRVTMDGKEINNVKRTPRNDVLSAVTGYGSKEDNKNPGFETEVSTVGYNYGTHEFKVEIITKNGDVLSSYVQNVIFESPKSRMYVENINNDSLNGKINISGWAMSTDKEASLEVYIDNNKIESKVTRISRNDVLNAVTGYGDSSANPNPGFDIIVDINNIKDGEYSIEVRHISSTGITISKSNSIIDIKKNIAKINIESDYQIPLKENMKISGWMMTTAKDAIINLYIDNKKVESKVTRISRNDVLNAVTGYGDSSTNPNPGFEFIIDGNLYDYGEHTIRLVALSTRGEIIEQVEKKIEFIKPGAKMFIESFGYLEDEQTINISGWLMCEDENAVIKVVIDGKEFTNVERTSREDVLNAVTDYGGKTTNKNPGFSIDITSIESGLHKVSVEVLSGNNDILLTETKILKK